MKFIFCIDILLKKNTHKLPLKQFVFAVITLVIVLTWFPWCQRYIMQRQRHVIKVDPRCASEVWFHEIHGLGRGISLESTVVD